MVSVLEAMRESPGAGPLLRTGSHAEIEQSATRAFAAPYLRFAVCPTCGARNPEGVAEERRDHRNIKLITLAVTTALAAAAYFIRWVAFATIAGFAVLAAVTAYHARHGVSARVMLVRVLELSITAGAIVILWPRLSALVPLVMGIAALRGSGAGVQTAVWTTAAERLRFLDTTGTGGSSG